MKIDAKTFIDKLENMKNDVRELGEKYPFLNISWDDDKLKEYLMEDIKDERLIKLKYRKE